MLILKNLKEDSLVTRLTLSSLIRRIVIVSRFVEEFTNDDDPHDGTSFCSHLEEEMRRRGERKGESLFLVVTSPPSD